MVSDIVLYYGSLSCADDAGNPGDGPSAASPFSGYFARTPSDCLLAYMVSRHEGSLHKTLIHGILSTRPKRYGGPTARSVYACKTLTPTYFASTCWKCVWKLPNRFSKGDGIQLCVSSDVPTKKEADEHACRLAFIHLLLERPGEAVLRPLHWNVSIVGWQEVRRKVVEVYDKLASIAKVLAGGENAAPVSDSALHKEDTRKIKYPRLEPPELFLAKTYPELFPHGMGCYHGDHRGLRRTLRFQEWGRYIMRIYVGILFEMVLKSYPSGPSVNPASRQYYTQWKPLPPGSAREVAMHRPNYGAVACAVAWRVEAQAKLAGELRNRMGVDVLVEEIPDLRLFGCVDDHYASFEWSEGGMLHAHIAFWVVGAPRIDKIEVPREKEDGS